MASPQVDEKDVRITDGMHERKAPLAELSDAVIAVAGGLGTLEEFAEVCTWTQLSLHTIPAAVLNTNGFFDELIILLDRAVEDGFLTANTRTGIIVERGPGVLLERLILALATD